MHAVLRIVVTTTKEEFGVAVDEEIVQEVDELVAECDKLGVNRYEIVEAIQTAFVLDEPR